MFSLFLAGIPPGNSSKMLQRKQRIASGMRVIPRHFAKFPEHMIQSFFVCVFQIVKKYQSKGSRNSVLTLVYSRVPFQLLVPVDLRGDVHLCIYIYPCHMMSPCLCQIYNICCTDNLSVNVLPQYVPALKFCRSALLEFISDPPNAEIVLHSSGSSQIYFKGERFRSSRV